MNDPYNLQRFVDAQNPVYEEVCRELRAGDKTTHWMWFIFPQVRGLGHSATATHFSISSLDEARAYLDHPVLGARLREYAEIVNALDGRSVSQIFGYPDDLKFHSSMTLFNAAAPDDLTFRRALAKYYCGAIDERTIELLK
jgi:uncharacterized protein (DUF1810 family)